MLWRFRSQAFLCSSPRLVSGHWVIIAAVYQKRTDRCGIFTTVRKSLASGQFLSCATTGASASIFDRLLGQGQIGT